MREFNEILNVSIGKWGVDCMRLVFWRDNVCCDGFGNFSIKVEISKKKKIQNFDRFFSDLSHFQYTFTSKNYKTLIINSRNCLFNNFTVCEKRRIEYKYKYTHTCQIRSRKGIKSPLSLNNLKLRLLCESEYEEEWNDACIIEFKSNFVRKPFLFLLMLLMDIWSECVRIYFLMCVKFLLFVWQNVCLCRTRPSKSSLFVLFSII